MSITRLETHPGLSAGTTFTEVAYATGNATWPTARVRITPILEDPEPRVHEPNAPAVPRRVAVRFSASLVDAEGQVIRIGGQLLLGFETTPTYQFETNMAFEPIAFVDAGAAITILPLLRQARDLTIAHAAGLLPPMAGEQPDA